MKLSPKRNQLWGLLRSTVNSDTHGMVRPNLLNQAQVRCKLVGSNPYCIRVCCNIWQCTLYGVMDIKCIKKSIQSSSFPYIWFWLYFLFHTSVNSLNELFTSSWIRLARILKLCHVYLLASRNSACLFIMT